MDVFHRSAQNEMAPSICPLFAYYWRETFAEKYNFTSDEFISLNTAMENTFTLVEW